jgi:DNA gyrase subunit A
MSELEEPSIKPTIATDVENGDEFDDSIKETRFGKIKPIKITDELERSYLDYAMSVIVARALPDVRDGLKPVHRRILFAMHDMGLNASSPYKKSARIVGEVLGKYHPHGDTAVYDALVRLAQDFSMRYPLIDGQGNFGSVDGDSAAAMRYTEARLSKISAELLTDLDKKTVDFADNFDGSQQEPVVLPALLPNLLLMGGDGIAVGMATKIPPHNLHETIDAVLASINKGAAEIEPLPKDVDVARYDPKKLIGHFQTEITIDQMLEHIQGPDFPTAGIMYDWSAIKEVYHNGKGRIVIRGRATIEEDRGGKLQIVITEIPYQVNKAKLVTRIADLVKDKKVQGISDIRDESDREGLRVVIDLKRDARPKALLNSLYQHTELQVNYPANMVALNSQGIPQVMNLKTIITEYVRHRQLVVARRSQYELISALDRAHILEGLLIALGHLDEVIAIIRNSPDADIARGRLIKTFGLSEIQATAILDMQLRRLAALERKKIEDEYATIKAKIDFLTNLLKNPQTMLELMSQELSDLKAKYKDQRKTQLIKQSLDNFSEEDLIPAEEVVVTVTETGYIKRLPPSSYRSQHRGGKGVSGMTTKEDDAIRHILSANTHDFLLIFTNKGKVFKIKVYELPTGSRQAKGQALINLINIEPGEEVQNIITMSGKFDEIKDKFITLATKEGLVKRTSVAEFQNIRTSGIIAIILNAGDELVWGDITSGDRDILLITHMGKSIRFPEAQIKFTARDTKGVKGIDLSAKDHVCAVEAIDPGLQKPEDKRKKFFHDLLVVTEKGMGKRTPFDEYPKQNRGGQGVKVMNITDKTGKIAVAMAVDHIIDQIIITTKAAQTIKLTLNNIPQLKRPTQGVILMRPAKSGDFVSAAAAIEKSPDDAIPTE